MTNLKGYITNTDIDAERVIAEYHGLWVWNVFSEFQKGHWKCTPCFTLQKEGLRHMYAPCFIVCNIYKELERLVGFNKIAMSVDHVLDAAKTITTIRIKMPENGSCFTKTLFLTEKHLAIKTLCNQPESVS